MSPWAEGYKDLTKTVNIEIVATMSKEIECSVKTEGFLDNVKPRSNISGK